jgi:hypothetical protein
MPNRLWIAAVVAVTPITALTHLSHPAQHDARCVLGVQGGRHEQRALMSMLRTHSADAHRYRIDGAKPSEVELVIDDAVCERAADAYSSVVRSGRDDRRVIVMKVDNRYVVRDPDLDRAITFDSNLVTPLAIVVE